MRRLLASASLMSVERRRLRFGDDFSASVVRTWDFRALRPAELRRCPPPNVWRDNVFLAETSVAPLANHSVAGRSGCFEKRLGLGVGECEGES